ncbi:MAG: murein biosynthesis integral membrane protein MurJ [Acidobacteria bacterium]|nr:MAG: murein biosynthesis integral membrane protein MurJ [Acidobacteriota bacterium]
MTRRLQAARAAGTVSFAVSISRILGLVREQVLAHYFGANLYSDAWRVAFRIPNLLRDLFAEGALSSAFVPTFTEYLRKRGKEDAWLLGNLVVNGLMVLLGLFALALLLFPNVFVFLMAEGFRDTPDKFEVTAQLLRILSPFLMFIALASVAMGMLNTLNHFFLPALAPALFNVANILAGIFLVPAFERYGVVPIYAMAIGALAGGILQFAVQLPVLWRHGYRYRFRLSFHHEGVRRIARLIGPAVIGISAVELNVLINTQLASQIGYTGPLSWLEFAFRIIYLPIGLFGVSVGVVNLREVSAHAADEKWEELKETVANSLKLTLLVALPSTFGLIVLARPIVRVLFQHGRFTPADTHWTAYALIVYSIGLTAYSLIKTYVPTFYALKDIRTPVRVSVTAVAVNVGLNLFLMAVLPLRYKYLGLAFGTSTSVILNSVLLGRGFRRRLGSLGKYAVGSAFLKAGTASAIMGICVYFLHRQISLYLGDSLFRESVALAITISVAVVIYFGLAHLLHVEEVRMISARVRRLVR